MKISPCSKRLPFFFYIATMVSSMCWNDTCNVLATVSDHRLSVWYNPAIAYIDQDLVQKTRVIGEQG